MSEPWKAPRVNRPNVVRPSSTWPQPRDPGLLVGSLLALTTALAILLLAESLRTPIAVTRNEVAPVDLEVAHRFYAAINEVLETGRAEAIAAVVASDIVEHPARPAREQGRVALVGSLLSMRATTPGLRLEVGGIVPSGVDVVEVSIRIDGGEGGTFLHMPLPAETWSEGWGPSEQLRIDSGRVVERWASGAPPRFEPLSEANVSSPVLASPRIMGVVRIDVDAGTTLDIVNGLTTRVLFVDEGRVDVVVASPPSPDGTPIVIDATTSLVTTPGARFSVSVDEGAPASLFMVIRFGFQSDVMTDEAAAEIVKADALALAAKFPIGVEVDELAASLVPSGIEAVEMFGRVTLAEGSTLTWPASDAMALVACEDGSLTIASQSAAFPVRSGRGDSGRVGPRWLHAGQHLAIAAGASTTWRAQGQTTVLVVALRSARTVPAPIASPAPDKD